MHKPKIISIFASEKETNINPLIPKSRKGTSKMKKSVYKEKSATAEGRKNLHGELLSEIKQHMDKLAENAPEANKEKVNAIFATALSMMENQGNSILFDFFASDDNTDKDFIRHTQDIIKGKL